MVSSKTILPARRPPLSNATAVEVRASRYEFGRGHKHLVHNLPNMLFGQKPNS